MPSPPPPGLGCAQEEVFCDEFHLADLRVYENCVKLVKVGGVRGVPWVSGVLWVRGVPTIFCVASVLTA